MKLATIALAASAAALFPHPAAAFLPAGPTRPATRLAASVEKKAKAAEAAAAASTEASAPDVLAYSRAYKTVFTEQPCSVSSPSLGSLPPDLRGTYYRCGPAMFSAGSLPPPLTSLVKPKSDPVPDGEDTDRMVAHPFEGDGAVLAATFPGDGTLCSRFRYVRTNAFTNERKRGSKMYDAMESTRSLGPSLGCGQANDFPLPAYRHHLQPGLNRKRKNTSNTRAVFWSRKLLTLWEGGLPYKLDALALSTEGRSQLGGVLKEGDLFGAGMALDPARRRVLFYSNRQDSGGSEVKVYEFNSKFRLVQESGSGGMGIVEEELPGFALLSDIACTENYSVFVQPDVKVNGMQFLMSKEPGKSIELTDGGALLHLIPRVGSAKPRKTIPIPADGLSHADVQFCNAYESDDGKTIIVDAIRSDPSRVGGEPLEWPWATTPSEYARTASRKSLWRYTVDVGGGNAKTRLLSKVQAQFGVINPELSGREHRYVYAATGGPAGSDATPPRGVGKFDVRSGESDVWIPEEPHEFCGEPMYAPRAGAGGGEGEEDSEHPAGEDDGYILAVLYDGDAHESSLVVLEARSIRKGPVARVPLGGLAVPHGLHGCFASEADGARWETDEIGRRAKLSDKMEGRGSMWNEVKSDFSGLGLRLDDIEEYFGDVI